MSAPNFFSRSRLTQILWAFRREFALAGAFSLLANLLMLTPTLYMLWVFDRVYVSQNELTLLALTLFMLALLGVMGFSEWLRSRLLVRAGVQFDNALNDRVFRAGFRAELEQSGHKASQALNDLTQIRQFLTGNGTIAFFDAPWTPVYIAVSWLLHPLLGIVALVFVANLVFLAWLNQRVTARPTKAASEAELELNKFVHSKLRNAEVVESMGMLPNLRRKWAEANHRSVAAGASAHGSSHRFTAVVKFFRYVQSSLALGVGALLAIEGEITIGSMIAGNVLVSRASQPIEMLVMTWSQFMSSRESFERLEKLLEDHPPADDGARSDVISGAVELKALTATAPGRAEAIIKPISATFAAGEVVAVIGPSGSGKSTLARSMVGIWPHTGGEVLLDGIPVHEFDREVLGPMLGYLPQDVELFDGTIAENIARFGELDPPQVIEAAQRAGLHEMILRFPKGYDTPIGAGGSVLSGGQRQRVALARALYGDPRLLVLDEPNANLDDAGEAALVEAVRDLKARGRTVFLVTHRMSALAVVDRLLVLQNGVAIADGPRDAVLAALRGQQPQPGPGPATHASPQPA
jgi:ATP-binding cassette subfamily C exporter for protease/lipase